MRFDLRILPVVAACGAWLTIDSASGAEPAEPAADPVEDVKSADAGFDAYGGYKAIRSEATGFFRLEQIDGRHYFITPDGHGFRALGLNHFHMMETKTPESYDEALANLKKWGFNAGCYQGPRWMWNRIPYTKGINLVPVSVWKRGPRFGFRDVFDPEFLQEMEAEVRQIVEPQRENSMLIGYFLTDIPIWKRTRSGEGWLSFYEDLPADSPGGAVYRRWRADNRNADEDAFLPVIAKQLYSTGCGMIRKYDPNHLILGDRYHERVDMPESVVREALPYIDAISIQPVVREFDPDAFDKIYESYGKPIYIADHVSAFATPGFPKTMGRMTTDPALYVAYYRRYVTAALARPYVVGFNKCQYQDEVSPTGMLKQGMVRQDETLYPTVDGVAEANREALRGAYPID
ncbi:MAG: hypothetical protein AAF907_00985 [Planctomycetota bacterium]